MKTDPRTKLLLIVCLSTLAVIAVDIIYLSIIFCVAAAVNALLGTNIIKVLPKMRFLLSVIVFISVAQSLTVKGGAPLLYIKNIVFVSTAGLLYGGEFALRMSIVILSSLIALSTGSRDMIDGLIKMRIPYEIAFMVSITLRFLPVFRDEFSNRLNALRLRGFDLKKAALGKKLKIYSYLLAPAVSGSIIRSRELAESIESRGFRAFGKRTSLRDLTLKSADYFVIILTLACAGGFAAFMYIKGALL
ncbi:MAG: energy-coupling factor transporter transmembrane component T [Clostridia bacterium]|nr:energy-coupling factor transporter transmembrane component T [Clostridia bacterium]